MRAYFFQNFYLQGIHAGIQSQHTTAEMFIKYIDPSVQKDLLYEWATQYKTTVVLNGGNQINLKSIIGILSRCQYPWASFNEGLNDLNGALTNVGVILPPVIYNAPKYMGVEWVEYCHIEDLHVGDSDLICTLQQCRLMD